MKYFLISTLLVAGAFLLPPDVMAQLDGCWENTYVCTENTPCTARLSSNSQVDPA